jgi:transcriptional regulator with XRE-family HTH domain
MTGEELKSWRLKRNLTQEELGEILGVAKNSVFRWEAGMRKVPSFLHLALVAIDLTKGGEKNAVRKKAKRKMGN